MTTARLDLELVRRGLARSRRHAGELIAAGRVTVDGVPTSRSATALKDEQSVTVSAADDPGYASRAGHKLAGALDRWIPAGLRVEDRVCLDAGASTGGFTDVLLRHGARSVAAVDVGHGQLVEALRADPRVESREGVNVRNLVPGDLAPPPELVVADLSFISLTLVLPALAAVAADGADLVVMVKPQFEVGRERLGSGGVVRDPGLRAEAVLTVARAAVVLGLRVVDVCVSPLPGPSGNVEFFLWLRRVGEAHATAGHAVEASGARTGVTAAEATPDGATAAEVGLTDAELVQRVAAAVADGGAP
ncbi:TlyA family RNA methyltransferase [Cellulomonas cellasea]|uniref:23S rRNA (Cytidine1920-2'-O)/16S rRNA (Cytidine1409-2'-O)-methyltransferase n=1 Tax=Cellulomonas cellasea TaxID=43670 RepID=A0A7W4YA28_9CELL|nr:TlyA family RNA methyltransferase [Cellulomonas cellasea]MBB2922193.1 23S rRNA (cytidine1920-2'-O)/16S rRNA (cytidine1409-2'-O)-methyltransferase [Cellulomonas cellasea]